MSAVEVPIKTQAGMCPEQSVLSMHTLDRCVPFGGCCNLRSARTSCGTSQNALCPEQAPARARVRVREKGGEVFMISDCNGVEKALGRGNYERL